MDILVISALVLTAVTFYLGYLVIQAMKTYEKAEKKIPLKYKVLLYVVGGVLAALAYVLNSLLW